MVDRVPGAVGRDADVQLVDMPADEEPGAVGPERIPELGAGRVVGAVKMKSERRLVGHHNDVGRGGLPELLSRPGLVNAVVARLRGLVEVEILVERNECRVAVDKRVSEPALVIVGAVVRSVGGHEGAERIVVRLLQFRNRRRFAGLVLMVAAHGVNRDTRRRDGTHRHLPRVELLRVTGRIRDVGGVAVAQVAADQHQVRMQAGDLRRDGVQVGPDAGGGVVFAACVTQDGKRPVAVRRRRQPEGQARAKEKDNAQKFVGPSALRSEAVHCHRSRQRCRALPVHLPVSFLFVVLLPRELGCSSGGFEFLLFGRREFGWAEVDDDLLVNWNGTS